MSRLVSLAVGLAVAVVALVGCGGGHGTSTGAASGAAPASSASADPRELRSIADLRAAFNAHAGEPRLILLISPT